VKNSPGFPLEVRVDRHMWERLVRAAAEASVLPAKRRKSTDPHPPVVTAVQSLVTAVLFMTWARPFDPANVTQFGLRTNTATGDTHMTATYRSSFDKLEYYKIIPSY
jgi:hypothetical protein